MDARKGSNDATVQTSNPHTVPALLHDSPLTSAAIPAIRPQQNVRKTKFGHLSHNMPTDFFDLPPELRNEVYNILWEDTPVFEKYYDAWNNVIVWSSKDTCSGGLTLRNTALPSWLLSCKQILQEDVAEFLFRSH
ncbi:hypothetical protein BKA58DRAFT_213749 [Alternaria rosae]|uniref:uncharacterized protein n=1 Tax=Alternaria rosae TaxID=1187941 RepID=UPI001E8E25AC|nr:uncharacterized protein BKA58DRAFT_213749 [Alternaria rosae]KAH6866880.1 hypothetical protein BKA58DRAFT_213749 [Alternaria rosae]